MGLVIPMKRQVTVPPAQKRGRAVTVADRIRPVKVAIIFALGRWLKMDSITVQRTCAQIYLCRPSDLSQDAGEEFIAYLKTLRPEAVN